jgi:hypothetical protein
MQHVVSYTIDVSLFKTMDNKQKTQNGDAREIETKRKFMVVVSYTLLSGAEVLLYLIVIFDSAVVGN